MKTKKIYRGRKSKGGTVTTTTNAQIETNNWFKPIIEVFKGAQNQLKEKWNNLTQNSNETKAYSGVMKGLSDAIFTSSHDSKLILPKYTAVTEIEYSKNKNPDGTKIGQTAVYAEKVGENSINTAINSGENFLARLAGSVMIDTDTEKKDNLKYEDMFKTVKFPGPEHIFNINKSNDQAKREGDAKLLAESKKGGKKGRRKTKKQKT